MDGSAAGEMSIDYIDRQVSCALMELGGDNLQQNKYMTWKKFIQNLLKTLLRRLFCRNRFH